LVNGVQNEKGLGRSREFLAWSGPDLEAVIDLGNEQVIREVIVHSLNSGGSWIYPPQFAEAFISTDGKTFTSVGKNDKYVSIAGTNGTVKISFPEVTTRFVKVFVKSLGIIPEGRAGAGNNAWLFVDEIEVN
jgi:hexosaminidase